MVAERWSIFFHEPHNREELAELLALAKPAAFISTARETEWTGKDGRSSPAASKR